jgi:hypothetical protein
MEIVDVKMFREICGEVNVGNRNDYSSLTTIDEDNCHGDQQNYQQERFLLRQRNAVVHCQRRRPFIFTLGNST